MNTFRKISWIFIPIGIAIFFVLLNCFVIINANVPSSSMENTIQVGSRIIGSRLAYISSDPQQGDIIIFKAPDTDELYIKRVIGVPGDTIEIKNGITYVNGEKLEEDYLKEVPNEDINQTYTVPENSYFVMGDNRNDSNDSRYWITTPFVTKDRIVAKALFIYFPFSEAKIL